MCKQQCERVWCVFFKIWFYLIVLFWVTVAHFTLRESFYLLKKKGGSEMLGLKLSQPQNRTKMYTLFRKILFSEFLLNLCSILFLADDPSLRMCGHVSIYQFKPHPRKWVKTMHGSKWTWYAKISNDWWWASKLLILKLLRINIKWLYFTLNSNQQHLFDLLFSRPLQQSSPTALQEVLWEE